ncbi:MAG: hypothetical protein M3P06_01370 [Acidobacteriota bacterium]|nr:hypothetical protein [Acidobacteriota bacterium]
MTYVGGGLRPATPSAGSEIIARADRVERARLRERLEQSRHLLATLRNAAITTWSEHLDGAAA